VSSIEIEHRTGVVELINWTKGETVFALRVDWRPFGTRRWHHFNMVPQEGQTIDELREHAGEAAFMVACGDVAGLDDSRFVDKRPPAASS
jgi:hypothetical protein